MNPREHYRKLAFGIKDDQLHRVALKMCDHIGEENAVRKEVIQQMLGLNDEKSVRDIFNLLTTFCHFPVCAHSGKAGYFLPPSKSATARTRAELRSRGEEIFAKERAYDDCYYPPDDAEVECYVQPALLDVPEPEPVPYWRW